MVKKIESLIEAKGGYEGMMFKYALKTKLENYRKDGTIRHSVYDLSLIHI